MPLPLSSPILSASEEKRASGVSGSGTNSAYLIIDGDSIRPGDARADQGHLVWTIQSCTTYARILPPLGPEQITVNWKNKTRNTTLIMPNSTLHSDFKGIKDLSRIFFLFCHNLFTLCRKLKYEDSKLQKGCKSSINWFTWLIIIKYILTSALGHIGTFIREVWIIVLNWIFSINYLIWFDL